jgi:hypothetical protein
VLTMKQAAHLLQKIRKPHGIKPGDLIRPKHDTKILGIVLSVHKDKTYPDVDRFYLKYSPFKDPSQILTQWVGNVEKVEK